MPKKKKATPSISPPTLFLSGLAVLLAFVLWLFSAQKLSEERPLRYRGNLNATVIYQGIPCPPLRLNKTPPCAGLYPNYPVRIHDAKTNEVFAIALTDEKGALTLNLPTGDYYWQSLELKFGEPLRTYFTVQTNQTTTVEFIIDTGIR